MDAEQGTIPLFVGGPADAVAALHGVFDRIGAKVHDLGSPEAAATFKLISNLVGMTNLAVLAEGYLLSQRAGIPPRGLHGRARRRRHPVVPIGAPAALADRGRLRGAVRRRARRQGPSPRGGHGPARMGLPTPVAAQGMSQFVAAIAHGHGDEDVVAVARVLDPTASPPDRDADGPDGT